MGRFKKLIIPVVVILLLIIGGVFYWQNQKDVKDLNKNLPEGIKVIKTLTGNYKLVNKIDGYEFEVPKEWEGIEEIKYVPEATEKGYTSSSICFEGKKGESRIMAIDRFKTENLKNLDLEIWTKNNFETFGLIGDFRKDKVGKLDVIKSYENVPLLGMSAYFFKKDSVIYAIAGGSEEFIENIIDNGKW
ncbi:MAG: hypothetical protein ACKKMO_02155 [Candidatus Nealsonbacteria bacterium]